MEQEVYAALDTRQRELLGTLFETESAKALAVALDKYQLAKATHIATMAPDFDNVLINRGNIQGARFAYDLMKFAHQRLTKEKQG